MLMIRLARTGRKNTATFRLVLQEKTQAPKSKALENLGSYNPHLKDRKDQLQLNTERIQYWMSKGAQPSATVHNMLVELGVINAPKRRVVALNKNKPQAEEAPAEGAATEGATEAAPATDAPAETPTETPAEVKPEEEKKEEAAA